LIDYYLLSFRNKPSSANKKIYNTNSSDNFKKINMKGNQTFKIMKKKDLYSSVEIDFLKNKVKKVNQVSPDKNNDDIYLNTDEDDKNKIGTKKIETESQTSPRDQEKLKKSRDYLNNADSNYDSEYKAKNDEVKEKLHDLVQELRMKSESKDNKDSKDSNRDNLGVIKEEKYLKNEKVVEERIQTKDFNESSPKKHGKHEKYDKFDDSDNHIDTNLEGSVTGSNRNKNHKDTKDSKDNKGVTHDGTDNRKNDSTSNRNLRVKNPSIKEVKTGSSYKDSEREGSYKNSKHDNEVVIPNMIDNNNHHNKNNFMHHEDEIHEDI